MPMPIDGERTAFLTLVLPMALKRILTLAAISSED